MSKLAHNRDTTVARTTSDFFSGSPPSLRSVEDDKRGTLMCFFDVEDDVGGGHACAFLMSRMTLGGGGTLALEDDGRGGQAAWMT